MEINRLTIQQLLRDTAQQVLMPLFNAVKREYKADGSIVTIADQNMQQVLGDALCKLYPETTLLGEEMPKTTQQALLRDSTALWCLDPVDGTSNFAGGMPFFSVSLAFIQRGEVTHGWVYDPIADECFSAEKDQGAWLNDQRLKAGFSGLTLQQTLACIDFKRLPKHLAARLIKEKPYGSHRCLGSIALELCWLAAGRFQLYLHGRQQLWDYAAAILVVQESGAFASTLKDEKVFSRSLKARSTCAAIDEHLFAAWRDYLRVPRCDD